MDTALKLKGKGSCGAAYAFWQVGKRIEPQIQKESLCVDVDLSN